MSSILLDTNIVIEFLRGNSQVKDIFIRLLNNKEQLYYTPEVIAEIFAGLRKGEEKPTRLFFDALTISHTNRRIGEKAGEYLKKYYPSHGIDFPDAMIAAHAHFLDAKLYTLNKKHYPMTDITFLK